MIKTKTHKTRGNKMFNKAYRTIEKESGKIQIFGNNHEIETFYSAPDWNDSNEEEECFKYKGHVYFISEFMYIDQYNPMNITENNEPLFDGYMSDSFFSGILVKYTEDAESIKAYTYIS